MATLHQWNTSVVLGLLTFGSVAVGCIEQESKRTQSIQDAAIDAEVYPADALIDLTPSTDRYVQQADQGTDMRILDLHVADTAVLDTQVADASPTFSLDCLNDGFVGAPSLGPQYAQFSPTLGPHCSGTNHQNIRDIERVVFVGDSVTVGTPPTDPTVYYRYLLSMQLAEHFGLQPPDWTWAQVNLIDGVSLSQEAGDFASCARWGARTDDLLSDNTLLSNCVPPEQRTKNTLFVMTIGGNDISNLTKDGLEGATTAALWAQTQRFVGLMQDAVRWVKSPDNFPNGSHIVYANMFEFTDGTGDVTACPAAGLAGFGAEWEDPELLAELVIWANEQYMRIAVESQADMVFMLEHFCGHGFNHARPDAPCYRGPSAENWFDLTCIHPNELGHRAIADLFFETITAR